jgi:hypothetical protein
MVKISGWTKELGNHERDMTAEEQADYDARQVEWNSDGEKLKRIKQIRLEKLIETDWWVFRGEMTDEQVAWRKSLRDIPTTYSASDYDALLEMEGEIPNRKLKHAIWSKP